MTGRVTVDTINTLVKKAQYAVRGKIVIRSAELGADLKSGKKLPFDKIIACNIGNPHALNQKPISFMRDVLSLSVNPSLSASGIFAPDVVARSQRYLEAIPGMGAYSESQGMIEVRRDVARFLGERDGVEGDPNNIFITNGASEGVRLCMQTILREPTETSKDGLLTPIPQYPLYSALTTLLKGELVPYYLDESNTWGCTVENLKKSLTDARNAGVTTRGLVVINPGNPTGQVLSEANMREIIQFCVDENICLMADEVYQENIWKTDAKFVSFRKVAYDMGFHPDSTDSLQMISFHSISKGFLGECGLRGGYFELFGIPADVKAEIYKLSSISLCSNTVGQMATGLMVQPPKEGDASFEKYASERDAILTSMRRRAHALSEALNKLEGVSCTEIEGAMYAFPTVTLPAKALEEANKRGIQADELYCMELLENTGIVVVPGSGFGQVEGTFHFRTTILPPESQMEEVMEKMTAFHNGFLSRFA